MTARFKRIAIIAMVAGVGIGVGLTVSSATLPADSRILADRKAAEAQFAASQLAYQEFLKLKKGEFGSPFSPADLEWLHSWSDRILAAELEVYSKEPERVAAYKGHLDRMVEMERMIHRIYESRTFPAWYKPVLEYYRLDAERRLARAKSK